MSKKVVVGMSGGVDSSAAAYQLKKEGYEVIGVTMKVWQGEEEAPDGGCCGLSAVDDARLVAESIGIPYYVMNFKNEFKRNVIDYFISEYLEGRTPNPCIACNRYVKWEALLDKARALGADYIATGHYAQIVKLSTGRLALKQSKSAAKDQTYALYSLTQRQLEHTLMPIGGYTKDEVRGIAKEAGLNTHNKPDSQEICFIPDNDYGGFIQKATGCESEQGDFLNVNGEMIGRHKGIPYYTIGQRKGLGTAFGVPMYVKEILPEKNQVVLASDEELFSSTLIAGDINFMSAAMIDSETPVHAKIRYGHKPAEAYIKMSGNNIECNFIDKQRAITPGQAAVFYQEGVILAGGVIRR